MTESSFQNCGLGLREILIDSAIQKFSHKKYTRGFKTCHVLLRNGSLNLVVCYMIFHKCRTCT